MKMFWVIGCFRNNMPIVHGNLSYPTTNGARAAVLTLGYASDKVDVAFYEEFHN
ncbi:hypothetical protein I4U23_007113 [Adineta vaga]|nr:hypothetical protein I4U23_007113 [Adineta vaga]